MVFVLDNGLSMRLKLRRSSRRICWFIICNGEILPNGQGSRLPHLLHACATPVTQHGKQGLPGHLYPHRCPGGALRGHRHLWGRLFNYWPPPCSLLDCTIPIQYHVKTALWIKIGESRSVKCPRLPIDLWLEILYTHISGGWEMISTKEVGISIFILVPIDDLIK